MCNMQVRRFLASVCRNEPCQVLTWHDSGMDDSKGPHNRLCVSSSDCLALKLLGAQRFDLVRQGLPIIATSETLNLLDTIQSE